MALKLYNTLSRAKESFERPLDGKTVRIYSCGPTVYDYAHVGNLRAYIFVDTLRRTLEYNGFAVRHVMNITDIGHLSSDADQGEDKMMRALRRERKPATLEALRELADFYTNAFRTDLRALHILPPHEMPRASDHIAADIELIEKLSEKNFTYETSDGVYFDTSAFPEYGKLGAVPVDDQQEGARTEVNPEKRRPADFALWKFSGSESPGFESPWGAGFPGWHIECSAMARQYLGQPFDIHTGGIEHIGTHHNGEIAQSEAAYDSPLALMWMHNEHVLLLHGKMAKSAGGAITLQSVKEKGFHPSALRYLFLQTHYRSSVRFSYDALQAAANGLTNMVRTCISSDEQADSDVKVAVIEKHYDDFLSHINNDLDTPGGLAVLWNVMGDSNISAAQKFEAARNFDRVLGLGLEELVETYRRRTRDPLPPDIEELRRKRDIARSQKDWQTSDVIRREIEERGYEVNDTSRGTTVTPRPRLSP